jgi:ParB/RepB/Spo0J family partition protein
MAVTFKNLPLSKVSEASGNPRTHFDEHLVRELAASIKTHGVLQPILVRPLEGGMYEVVCGARRYRASKMARLEAIPATIRKLDDDQALELQITENLQRKDIHPLEEALAIKRLHEERGMSMEEVASRLGKSQQYLYQRAKLADLIPELQKVFFEGHIMVKDAYKLARISAVDQRKFYNEEVKGREDRIDWHDIDYYIQDFHRKLKNAPFDIADASLISSAGACITCPKNSAVNSFLFPDLVDDPTCSDSQCWKQKANIAFDRKLKEAKEDTDTLIVYPPYSNAAKLKAEQLQAEGLPVMESSWSNMETISEPEPPEKPDLKHYEGEDDPDYKDALEEYADDLSLYNEELEEYKAEMASGKAVRAFDINSGEFIHVKLKKAATAAAGSDPEDDEIARIKEREARAEELDDEKIFQAVNALPKEAILKAEFNEQDIALAIYRLINNMHYGAEESARKLLGIKRSYSGLAEYHDIQKSKPGLDDLHTILKMWMLDNGTMQQSNHNKSSLPALVFDVFNSYHPT